MSMTVADDRTLLDEAVARVRYRATVLRAQGQVALAGEVDGLASEIGGARTNGETEALAALMGVTRDVGA